MYLSEHFSLEEMCHSNTAVRLQLKNEPNEEQLSNLHRLCEGLEDVRTKLGGLPIIISSGFRSIPVNRAVGSKDTSYHTDGLAADLICPAYGSVDDTFVDLAGSSIEFDKCILEFNSWIHIQFPKEGEKPRRQTLVIDREGVRAYAPKERF